MKLVDDARNWWKWHSVWALGVLGVVANVWLNSPELQAVLPPRVVSLISPLVLGLVFLLRIHKQVLALPKTGRTEV